MPHSNDQSRRHFLKQVVAGAAAGVTAGLGNVPLMAAEHFKAEDRDPKNLIVFGWDGAGLNNVVPMLHRGNLPNLQRFLDTRNGEMAPLQLMGFTNTLVSWSQVFTGLTYDQTGIVGNFHHDLETNLVERRIPIPYHPRFTSAVGVWTGLNVWYNRIQYEHSIFKPIGDLGYATGLFASKGYFSKTSGAAFELVAKRTDKCVFVHPAVDPTIPISDSEIDDTYLRKLRNKAFQFMTTHSKFFVFLHLDPDIYGHKYGEASRRYRSEIIRCDTVLGQMLDTFSPETTNIIVIADHGFDPGLYNHHNAPDAWMATDLLIDPMFVLQGRQKAFGTMRDVAHTILEYYNIPFDSMPLQMRGISLLA